MDSSKQTVSVTWYREETIMSAGVPIVLSIWTCKVSSPCIVFFPGTMTHPLFYKEFLEGLCSKGFNVIGIHPVGHGKSPRVKKLYSFGDMLENGKDAITYAQKVFNTKIVLMGSSQGGILAIALAGLDHRIKAVFPHNILIPDLPDSIVVTRFPKVLARFSRILVRVLGLVAKLMPRIEIPVQFYLDLDKVTRDRAVLEQLKNDPDGFLSYPLYFLYSLFSADMKQIRDGSIQCPVVVIVSKRDPLFPFGYTRKVYDCIKSPHKEMLLFDEDIHLLFNESVESVLDPIASKIDEVLSSVM